MCIIIVKTKTQKKPSIERLKKAYNYNSDGGGFMYVDNNKVVIDKGYMDVNSFIDRYKELCKKYNDFKNKSLVIHCRISTSGQVKKEYTHPYPLCNDYKNMKKTYNICDVGVAHNGVIKDYTPKTSKINDTMLFIHDYLFKMYKYGVLFNQSILNNISGFTSSKFAILTSDDNLYMIGDFIHDKQYYSNDTYKDYFYNKYDYYSMIDDVTDYINDNTQVIIDDIITDVKNIRIERDSQFMYDWYNMRLYEYTSDIINIIDNIELIGW